MNALHHAGWNLGTQERLDQDDDENAALVSYPIFSKFVVEHIEFLLDLV